MANPYAVHSLGASLVRRLQEAYPPALSAEHPCAFRLLSVGELAHGSPTGTTVTLTLYSMAHESDSGRATLRRGDAPASDADRPLALALYYLLTAWAATPEAEQSTLAWAMSHLHRNPSLKGAEMSEEAGWGAEETVQFTPAVLNAEEMARVWASFGQPYRLSVGYVARVVKIGADGER